MKKPSRTPSKGKRNKPAWFNATVITASLFWIWTALFHDIGSLYYSEMHDSFFNGELFGAYLNCTSQPLGFATGSIAYFLANKNADKKGASLIQRKSFLLAICVALFCLFYLSLEIMRSYALSSGIALCAVAVGTLLWMDFFVELIRRGSRSLVTTALASMATRRICSAFLPMISPTESFTVIIFLHAAFLALSYPGLISSAKGSSNTDGNASREHLIRINKAVEDGETDKIPYSLPSNEHAKRTNLPKMPWQLFLHLSCYGIGFGTIHGALGITGYLHPTEMSAVSRFAISMTGLFFAAVITVACTRKLHRAESLWQRVRGVVFPLVIVSYSLIPILGDIAIPSTLAEDGDIIYNVFFALGCFMMTEETDVKPSVIVSMGCFFKCMGFFSGILLGYALGSSGAIVDSKTSQLVTLTIFVAFSLGTFWIGNERQMRHWWGLRCVRTPQYQHNRILEEKCDKLARLHELSPRETELLAMLAQGKRAATIKEECDLSIFTVRNHIQNIYRKLDIHSMDELSRLVDNMQED